MSLIYPLPNRNSINLEKPTFTLDVNQVAIKPPDILSSNYKGLVYLEWNYFEPHSIELCVTPKTAFEITQGTPLTELGSAAYQRYLKSELYKKRPPEATLSLSNAEANELWTDMRCKLFPTVKDEQLNHRQIADVDQIFWHASSSGSTAENSVFVTLDGNFLECADDFRDRYGISIMAPNDAWRAYEPDYELTRPTITQANDLWRGQQELFTRIRDTSS